MRCVRMSTCMAAEPVSFSCALHRSMANCFLQSTLLRLLQGVTLAYRMSSFSLVEAKTKEKRRLTFGCKSLTSSYVTPQRNRPRRSSGRFACSCAYSSSHLSNCYATLATVDYSLR